VAPSRSTARLSPGVLRLCEGMMKFLQALSGGGLVVRCASESGRGCGCLRGVDLEVIFFLPRRS
jgi:hypothetical protein